MRFTFQYMSSFCTVKEFTEEDIPSIYELCRGNPTYYQYMKMEPSPENLREVFYQLPPKQTMENKYFLGYFQDSLLIALLDLIAHYPSQGIAWIGWFMLAKEKQGVGLGAQMIKELLSFLRREGFGFVRLGYIKGNQESETFWLRNGFIPTGAESETNEYTIVQMQKEL